MPPQCVRFGLATSGQYYQALLTDVLRPLLPDRAIIYVDDLLLFSSSYSAHKQLLAEAFECFRKANLSFNGSKCNFIQHELDFLGFRLTTEGLKVRPDRIDALLNLPNPTSIKEIRSFIGTFYYFRKFIRNFSYIEKFSHIPLTHLLRKDAKFVFDSQCQQAVDTLKHKIATPPVLSFPRFN